MSYENTSPTRHRGCTSFGPHRERMTPLAKVLLRSEAIKLAGTNRETIGLAEIGLAVLGLAVAVFVATCS